jgi:hypothetical protein
VSNWALDAGRDWPVDPNQKPLTEEQKREIKRLMRSTGAAARRHIDNLFIDILRDYPGTETEAT